MFGKKKQIIDAKKPALTPQELAAKIAEEAGLLPNELHKLLDSIAKVENKRTIFRQKAEKSVFGKKSKMTLPEAVELAKKRVAEREAREELRRLARKRKKLKYFETESRDVIEDEEYPRRLSPQDMGTAIESAKTRLLEEEKKKQEKEPVNYRALLILKVLDQMKVTEAARVAKKIAERQKRIGMLTEEEAKKLLESVQDEIPEIEQVEEKIQYDTTLDKFGKHLNTLIDDASDVVKEDYDSAASVMKQWVGAIKTEE